MKWSGSFGRPGRFFALLALAAVAGSCAGAPAPKPVEEPSFELTVLREDGSPVADAQVVVLRGSDALESAVTDPAGRASLDRVGTDCSVVVRAPAHAPFFTELDPSNSSLTMVLPEGDVIRGSVQVDGAPPDQPLRLRLHVVSPPLVLGSLPQQVTRVRGRNGGEPQIIQVQPELDGSFVIRGLSSDEMGTFAWDEALYLDDGARNPHVRSTPWGRLEDQRFLKLSRPTEVRLRLKRADGEEARGVAVSFTDGSREVGMRREGDSFVGFLAAGAERRIDLTFRTWGMGADTIVQQLTLPDELPRTVDLGLFELPAPRVLWLDVASTGGDVLSTARLRMVPGSVGWPPKTLFDWERGRMKVEILPKAMGFFVEADDHQTAWVDMPPPHEDELRVALAPASSISVTLEGSSADPKDFELWMFAWEPLTRVSRAGDAEGQGSPMLTPEEPTHGFCMEANWTQTGLRPGLPLRLELRDRRSKPAFHEECGTALARMDIAPLLPGEHRRVTFAFDARARGIMVRVLSPDGLPAPQASISVIGCNAPEEFLTNSRGEAEVKPLYEDLVSVWVRARGFPTSVRRDVPIASGEVTIVLDDPRLLEVELVVTESTENVAVRSVAVELDTGEKIDGRERAGRWIFDRLPPGEVTIVIRTESGSIRQLHDTAISSATVVVGEPGRILAMHHAEASITPPLRTMAVAPARVGAATWRSARGWPTQAGESRYELEGLAFGTYDVWLEESSTDLPAAWSRAGPSKRVVLDADHPWMEVDLTP